MSKIINVSEWVFSKIECEHCGHIEGSRHGYPDEDIGDDYTCPECGKTSKVDEEDFVDE